MKEQVSALMDDGLENDEIPAVVDALASEPELQEAWGVYHLIGDTLRAQATPVVDVTSAVLAAVAVCDVEIQTARDAAESEAPAKPAATRKSPSF